MIANCSVLFGQSALNEPIPVPQPETPSAETNNSKAAATPFSQGSDESKKALESVLESIELVKMELSELRSSIESATEVEKEELTAQVQELTARKDALQSDFESIATGVDPVDYEGSLTQEFLLSDEIDALLEPIIGELKELTKKPREIEQLRSQLYDWERRYQTTEEALNNLDDFKPENISEEVLAAIQTTRETWQSRRKQAENRIQAISFQLEQAQGTQPSILETIRSGLRSFYRSRGRNFLLCIFAFFGTLFSLRFLYKQVNRHFPWNRKKSRPFYLRLIDVGFNLFSFIGAIIAAILTLYATGDWVLMGLAIIILLGVVLAAKNALPKFYDQGRLLLNLGEIREGERVVYQGVPWKVERLSFYTILRNEELRGGMIRLPVNQLSGLVSRPIAEEGEIWFPCREGDWVNLSDEGLGRVIMQTPEYVQLVKLGGAKIAIPATDFIGKSPVNLSQGFRVSTTFGVDYQHQEICTTEIPEKMWAFITKGLVSLVPEREYLLSLKVELSAAGASSLDYAIIADFDGAMASKYQVIVRALQGFAVDCCNENGWIIPFTQITLHNAYEESHPTPTPTPEKTPKLP